MNGIHDMGGMHGMGLIRHEKNEPVFHESWEGRVFAINRAIQAWRKWNIDAGRHAIEVLPPADYLRMSYYERWLTRNIALLVKHGLVTQEEIDTGKAAPGSQKATPPLSAAAVRAAAADAAAQPDRPLVVLVSDRLGRGTNVLLLSPPDAIPFSFGSGSRASHIAAAEASGATALELDGPLTLDLDLPEDLILAEELGLLRPARVG
jgi:nitrile hydratase